MIIMSSRHLCMCDASYNMLIKSIPKSMILIYHSLLSLFTSLNAACPFGSFKASQGDQQCLQCPINSRTTNEGATNCVCRSGYYRADSDPLQMPCTSMSFSYAILCHLWCFFENQTGFDVVHTNI